MIENVRVSAGSRDSWWIFAENYLRSIWTWHHLVDGLIATAERFGTASAIRAWIESGLPESDVSQLLDQRDRLLSASRRIQVEKLIACLTQLRQCVHRDWLLARMVNQAVRLTSGDAAKRRAAIANSRDAFDIMLSRLRRYRDYVTHGAWVPHEGAETIESFATALAAMVANAHIESVTCGLNLETILVSGRDAAEAKLVAIAESGRVPELA